MAVRVINESLPADSEKKYGKARLKQQEIEQKLNENLGDYTETLNKLKEIKHMIYSGDIKDGIPSEMLFLLGRLKTEIDHIVNELDKYNSVEDYKIKVEESKELNDTLKDKYEKSKNLLAKIFDMNITDKERDALRKELKELIK